MKKYGELRQDLLRKQFLEDRDIVTAAAEAGSRIIWDVSDAQDEAA